MPAVQHTSDPWPPAVRRRRLRSCLRCRKSFRLRENRMGLPSPPPASPAHSSSRFWGVTLCGRIGAPVCCSAHDRRCVAGDVSCSADVRRVEASRCGGAADVRLVAPIGVKAVGVFAQADARFCSQTPSARGGRPADGRDGATFHVERGGSPLPIPLRPQMCRHRLGIAVEFTPWTIARARTASAGPIQKPMFHVEQYGALSLRGCDVAREAG